jgi:hypothetical protein
MCKSYFLNFSGAGRLQVERATSPFPGATCPRSSFLDRLSGTGEHRVLRCSGALTGGLVARRNRLVACSTQTIPDKPTQTSAEGARMELATGPYSSSALGGFKIMLAITAWRAVLGLRKILNTCSTSGDLRVRS